MQTDGNQDSVSDIKRPPLNYDHSQEQSANPGVETTEDSQDGSANGSIAGSSDGQKREANVVLTPGEYDEQSEGFKEVTRQRSSHSSPVTAAIIAAPVSPAGSLTLAEMAFSERRYRRLFEAARDGILILNIDTGQITDANPFMYELLGYPPGALLGKELWEIGLFEDQVASQAAFVRLHAEGYIRYEDLPLETQSGERREVEFVSNVYREDGHIVIQCNIRDITDRKHVEQELQAALVREMRITEALQHSLTAEIAEEAFPGLEVASYYEPALKEAQVGGDFFDAFSFRSRKKVRRKTNEETGLVALAVGDVMGKGVLAAALAGRVKDVMRAFLREDEDPARTLTRLNDYLCDVVSSIGYSVDYRDEISHKTTILTLALVIINPQTGAAAISSAGAEPPVILRASGAVEVIEPGGLLLGIQPEVTYKARRLQLHPGDTLLMATDGITEARRLNVPGHRRRGSSFLGHDGMVAIAKQHRGVSSIRAMSRAMVNDARAFGGSFNDDVCLLVARRREPEIQES
jgi:PAS domain S-box-containing protein